MHTSRVSPSQIDSKRLDSDYYHPDHLATERILRGLNAEALRHVGKFWAGPFGSELPSSLYRDEGVPLFRVGNVGSMEVRYEGMAHLDATVHEELSASEVGPGDLLIVKASVGEKICRIPDSMPRANITQHIIAMRSNGKADLDYIAAFLFSRYGRSQLVRRSLGSLIQYLGVNDARTVLYPPIDQRAQNYIGEKVRQAERLRERARHLENAFHSNLLTRFPELNSRSTSTRRSTVVLGSDVESKLIAGAYDQERVRIRKYLRAEGGKELRSLATLATPVAHRSSPTDSYIGLNCISENSCFVTRSTVAKEEVSGSVRILAEGPVISRLRPYLNKVTYVPKAYAGSLGSTELLCVVPMDGVSGWYLYGVLKLDATVAQLNPIATGSTHPRVEREDVLDVMVPWLEDHQSRATLLNRAQELYLLSEALTTAARVLVDSLIEGKIEETTLIDAHRALVDGDSNVDRSLLTRLSASGLDASGEKLFGDPDSLFNALETVTRPVEEGR